ncbi:MAG: DUF4248 domain-containing protein [Bacteroidaceae bacterium]|nr:DUF4248 domain-containing protein [Bacteroidaceae bacterium]
MVKVKVYGRMELAQAYLPNYTARGAWRRLRQWFSINPRLSPLLQLGRRTFTPAEVKLIFDELGEP